MTAERTSSFGALALVGPCSTGRAAPITRRQLQPGNDCLRPAAGGGLVIDPDGPERVISSGGPRASLAHWLSVIRESLRRASRRGTRRTASKAPNRPTPSTHATPPTVGTARTGHRWNRAGVGAALMALFALGMAVQHRAEIVNWPMLIGALAGRGPEVPAPTPRVDVPASAVATAGNSSPPATQVTKPLVPTPIPGRPLRDLPDPLPDPDASLLARSPGAAAHRTTGRASRSAEAQSEDNEEAVSVELHGHTDQPANKADDPVDVTIAPLKPPASTASPPIAPAKSSFKTVTVNSGALVVRGTATSKFQQVAPGERLPNGQTLTRIDEADGTFTTNAGTFNFGEFN